jgi:RimJ/RimL family protein N-acetyltransferase
MEDPTTFTPILTPRLVLRRFHQGDLAIFLAYRNDPQIARYQGWSTPMSEAAARAFIEEAAGVTFGPTGYGGQIAVALATTNELVGDLYLGSPGGDGRQGVLGYSLARAYHGRGLMSEAARALLGYAFGVLGLHRMVASVDTRNDPSIKLLERLGMRREGHLRECYYDERVGAWIDEYLYALLRAEWAGDEREA